MLSLNIIHWPVDDPIPPPRLIHAAIVGGARLWRQIGAGREPTDLWLVITERAIPNEKTPQPEHAQAWIAALTQLLASADVTWGDYGPLHRRVFRADLTIPAEILDGYTG